MWRILFYAVQLGPVPVLWRPSQTFPKPSVSKSLIKLGKSPKSRTEILRTFSWPFLVPKTFMMFSMFCVARKSFIVVHRVLGGGQGGRVGQCRVFRWIFLFYWDPKLRSPPVRLVYITQGIYIFTICLSPRVDPGPTSRPVEWGGQGLALLAASRLAWDSTTIEEQ